MMAVAVETAVGFHSGTPHELFTLSAGQTIATRPLRSYDVYPDGQHFIAAFPNSLRIDPALRLQLVLNWFEELQRRAPAK